MRSGAMRTWVRRDVAWRRLRCAEANSGRRCRGQKLAMRAKARDASRGLRSGRAARSCDATTSQLRAVSQCRDGARRQAVPGHRTLALEPEPLAPTSKRAALAPPQPCLCRAWMAASAREAGARDGASAARVSRLAPAHEPALLLRRGPRQLLRRDTRQLG